MRDIGKNIKKLREARKLTQEELAEKLFVTRQTVSNYETGRSRPDLDMLMSIAQVLETDVSSVLYGPPVPPDRGREVKRLAVCGILLAGLCLLWFGVLPVLREKVKMMELTCYGRSTALWLAVPPLTFLLGGWGALQLLSLTAGLKRLNDPRSVWVRRVTLVAVVLCWSVMLPFLVWLLQGDFLPVNGRTSTRIFPPSGIPLGEIYEWLFRRTLDLHAKAPWLYVPAGMLLWLCRSPDGNKEPPAE